jgi:DNA-binding NtrC family response regulator
MASNRTTTPPPMTTSTVIDGGAAGARGQPGYQILVMGPSVFASFPLPAPGEAIIGRGAGADVPLRDTRASRRHARLRLDAGGALTVEDLGSANGTRVRDQALEPGSPQAILPGEAIGVGALVLMVQATRPARAVRPVLAHAELEGRVDWECARAEATRGVFSVARLELPPGDEGGGDGATGAPGAALRALDVVARFGPSVYELLLPGLSGEAASALAYAFGEELAPGRPRPRVGVATYPADGLHAAALLARAGERARGAGGAGGGPSGGVGGGGGAGDLSPREPLSAAGASRDEAMRRVQALAARAAAGTINVLVLGETGAGKEVLARAVHAASSRAGRPFVAISCAALSHALLESELFGHERGAFTGAAQAKPGLLETAPGGTVFLDEVGELHPALQAKVLRAIETREIVRVGGVRPRKIDVRFVAATNRDLAAAVAEGSFRRDLYFRLNGMTLTIPPLRERPNDLPRLARQFVAELAGAAGRPRPPELTADALAMLLAYHWPGNVRELRNVIERALLLCDGASITPEHLPADHLTAPVLAVRSSGARPAAPPQPPRGGGADGGERARVLEALAACGGNQSRAARLLGISRKVLLARLDAYGVARPRKPVGR